MEYKDTEDLFAYLRGGIDWLERLTNRTPVCRVFLHTVRLRRSAPPHLAKSQETEAPFRHSRSLVLHVPPFRTALVVGFWSREGYTEDEALLRAVTPHKEFDEAALDDWDEDNARDVAFSAGIRSRARRGRLRSGTYAAGNAWTTVFPAPDRTESFVTGL